MKIAVIRVKSDIKTKRTHKDTLKMLRLYKTNTCVIIENKPSNLGMIEKLKELVTWGEITPETFRSLLTNKGRIAGKKPLTEDYIKEKLKLSIEDFTKEFFESKKVLKDIPGLKLFFKLNPPKGGYERQGIKKQFSLGGALGYRKDKINDLIRKMIQ